jgi:DNA replication protein DnaC
MVTSSDVEPGRAPRKEDVCPICGGAGFLARDVPPGHPDFHKLIPCRCKAQELEQRRRLRLEQMSNLGGLARMTFSAFLPDGVGLPEDRRRNLRKSFEAARAFAHAPAGWLILMGGYGCGKTHLAAAIANECVDRGMSALFVVVPDLLDYLRSAFAPHSEEAFDARFEAVRSAPLLILDELGVQAATPWAQEKLYQIINYRYNNRLPTVVTTNCTLEELDARIRSRLSDLDLCQMATITAGDFRQSGAFGNEFTQNELNSISQVADMTFERFSLRDDELSSEEIENLRNGLALARAYAEHPDGWLVFTGEHGAGKTHLAAAIANARTARGQAVILITAPDLLDYLRAAFSPDSQISFDKRFEEVRRAPLLILDDIGSESGTPWAREKLFQIINYRYNMRLPTVFTTALPIERIEPRLRARMIVQQRCQIFVLEAPSYTGGAAPAAPAKRPKSARPRS